MSGGEQGLMTTKVPQSGASQNDVLMVSAELDTERDLHLGGTIDGETRQQLEPVWEKPKRNVKLEQEKERFLFPIS